MNTFNLDVFASDKPFFGGECVSMVIPVINGQYGIQAMHSNLIVAVVPGMMKIVPADGETIFASVSEGLAKIENNHVLLLVNTAEHPEEIWSGD